MLNRITARAFTSAQPHLLNQIDNKAMRIRRPSSLALTTLNQRRNMSDDPVEVVSNNEKVPPAKDGTPYVISVPSKEDAFQMPRRFCELNNETLSIMACNGVHGAHKERLLREIMRVDGLSWIDANDRLKEINAMNDRLMLLFKAPYFCGISLGVFSGIASIPMVFDKNWAIWFNDAFVQIEQPPVEELDTMWKVGEWTWQWMEPALGTASFVLLAMQLVRAQMSKMHLKPYTEFILAKRADRLANTYPQYSRPVVRDFAKSDPWNI